jgi:hypothetical protein
VPKSADSAGDVAENVMRLIENRFAERADLHAEMLGAIARVCVDVGSRQVRGGACRAAARRAERGETAPTRGRRCCFSARR